MNDRTRRSLVVLLFLVFGPTFMVTLVGWIALRRSPLAVQYEALTIRTGTGVDFTIDSVEYLRWDFWKYGQVEFSHPKTGQPFIVFSDLSNRLFPLKISRPDSFFSTFLSRTRTELFRKIHSPFVSIAINSKADVTVLGDLLLNQFGNRFADRKSNLVFHFDELEIYYQGFHFNLIFVKGSFRFEEGECSLECTFNFQEKPSQEPISFTITRPKNDSPELIIEFRTDKTEVPVQFLALLFPGLASLGPESCFHGTIRGEQSKRGSWIVTFEDMKVENANLMTLGAELTPYRLSGQVTLGVRAARIELNDNLSRFLDAAGWIQIVNGSIERQLLAQLVDDWQLSPNPNNMNNSLYQNKNLLEILSGERQDVTLALVSFDVILGKDGVLLRPEPSVEKSGLVIEQDQDGLFKYYLPKQISKSPIPYSALFYSFSPVEADRIPLTPQIQRIVPYIFPSVLSQ